MVFGLFDDDKKKESSFSIKDAINNFYQKLETNIIDPIRDFSENINEDFSTSAQETRDSVSEALLSGSARGYGLGFGALRTAQDFQQKAAKSVGSTISETVGIERPEKSLFDLPDPVSGTLKREQRRGQEVAEYYDEVVYPNPDSAVLAISKSIIANAPTALATFAGGVAAAPSVGAGAAAVGIGTASSLYNSFLNTGDAIYRAEKEGLSSEEIAEIQSSVLIENLKYLPVEAAFGGIAFTRFIKHLSPSLKQKLLASQGSMRRRAQSALGTAASLATGAVSEGFQEVYEGNVEKEARKKIKREWSDFSGLIPRPQNWTDDQWSEVVMGTAAAGVMIGFLGAAGKITSLPRSGAAMKKINEAGNLNITGSEKDLRNDLTKLIAMATVKKNPSEHILQATYAGIMNADRVSRTYQQGNRRNHLMILFSQTKKILHNLSTNSKLFIFQTRLFCKMLTPHQQTCPCSMKHLNQLKVFLIRQTEQ